MKCLASSAIAVIQNEVGDGEYRPLLLLLERRVEEEVGDGGFRLQLLEGGVEEAVGDGRCWCSLTRAEAESLVTGAGVVQGRRRRPDLQLEEVGYDGFQAGVEEVPAVAGRGDPGLDLKPQLEVKEHACILKKRHQIQALANQVENEVINVEDEEDARADEPSKKRGKKTTSECWDHFYKTTKTVEVDGQKVVEQWAKCKYCTYEGKRNSRNGTSVFLNHIKMHSVKSGQQLLKLEKKEVDSVSVETYRTRRAQILKNEAYQLD
ncbi:hypothetical protein ACQ4PT_032100 [Festuca glaucescens]